jgi:uncharacterized protein
MALLNIKNVSNTVSKNVHVFPSVFMVYITEQCNLRCDYCFVLKKSKSMSSDTAARVASFIFSREASGVHPQVTIVFFGGEPFLEVDIMEEMMAQARRLGPRRYKKACFSATTNGTLATDRVERVIREGRMRLLVSLDGGLAASSHRPFVSGKSSYALVARNLPRLVNWASHTVVRMTFHPQALDLVANVRHALELGAPAVALCPVVEASWAGHEEALDEAYQALAEWYIAEARKGTILPLEVTHTYLRQRHAVSLGEGRPPRACGVGTTMLGITTDGHIMPCHRFLKRPDDWLGTVDQPDLGVKRQPYLHLSSRNLLGCDTCVAESLCGGGCRAVALTAGYDLQSGLHPSYCLTTRAHARAVHRIYDTLMAEQNTAFKTALQHSRALNPALTELLTR